MGLFGNKAEVCIAFVGKYSQRVGPLQERAVMNSYRARLQSLIQLKYPGLTRYRVWFFGNWTDEVFSASTLRKVDEEGFSAFDSGEKKELCDAIEKALVLQYNVMRWNNRPAVVVETIEPYTGIFAVLCRVSVNEKKLQ